MWFETGTRTRVKMSLQSLAIQASPTHEPTNPNHTCKEVVDGTFLIIRAQNIRTQVQLCHGELNTRVNLVTIVPSNEASVFGSSTRLSHHPLSVREALEVHNEVFRQLPNFKLLFGLSMLLAFGAEPGHIKIRER
jgi:hypothetical protein